MTLKGGAGYKEDKVLALCPEMAALNAHTQNCRGFAVKGFGIEAIKLPVGLGCAPGQFATNVSNFSLLPSVT